MRPFDFLKLSLIVFMGLEILSCAQPKSGLSSLQRQQLVSINSAMQTLDVAIAKAFDGSEKSGDGRTERLARQIVAGQCQQRLQKPRKDFATSWSGSELVQSERCPLYLSRHWTFDASQSLWSFHQDLLVRNPTFAEISGIRSFDLEGSLTARHPKESETVVQGSVNYSDFVVSGVGHIEAKVDVYQFYGEERGRGSAELTMSVGRQAYVARIEWLVDKLGGTEVRHFINDSNVDPREFDEAFSSFGLDEIMAKSLQMRYL